MKGPQASYRKRHADRARTDALRTKARNRAALIVARRYPVEYEAEIQVQCECVGIPRWLPPLPPAEDLRGKALRGEENPSARLTVDSVREIRIERARGVPLSHLARRFGVSSTTIRAAAIGVTWAHVDAAGAAPDNGRVPA